MDLEFDCPCCSVPFANARCATVGDNKPNLGDIVVCGQCGTVSWFTKAGLAIMSDAEQQEHISEEELKDIDFARRIIEAKIEQLKNK